ncbi:uncharacterized protein LOC125947092 [Dermacentor silvarum]|uniref:uncharacterized protein LOC125947092 n=1 Tax=Dermacentor silvarum TaxID=543639 RepID=UPI0021007AA6|nr:uncharacterized protein LOC125947092 [Dermacentor silvarum]
MILHLSSPIHSTDHTAVPLYEERKFIVFESSLDELLSVCPLCSRPCRAIDKNMKGTLLQDAKLRCFLGHSGGVGVACSSDKTHFRVQDAFLIPAVAKVWTQQQNVLFDEAIGRPLPAAGDGRADSPGLSAKYDTCSFLDIELNKVLHIETPGVHYFCMKEHAYSNICKLA